MSCAFLGGGECFQPQIYSRHYFLMDISAANIFYSVSPFISSALSSDKAFIFILIRVYCPHRSWESSPFLLKNTLILTTEYSLDSSGIGCGVLREMAVAITSALPSYCFTWTQPLFYVRRLYTELSVFFSQKHKGKVQMIWTEHHLYIGVKQQVSFPVWSAYVCSKGQNGQETWTRGTKVAWKRMKTTHVASVVSSTC